MKGNGPMGHGSLKGALGDSTLYDLIVNFPCHYMYRYGRVLEVISYLSQVNADIFFSKQVHNQ